MDQDKDRTIDELVFRAGYLVGRLDRTVSAMQQRLRENGSK